MSAEIPFEKAREKRLGSSDGIPQDDLEAVFQLSVNDPTCRVLVGATGFEFLLNHYFGEPSDPLARLKLADSLFRRWREAVAKVG